MPIIGSSAIIPPAAVGPQGPTGSVGFSGPAGASGFSGGTGPTGATGTYVASSYHIFPNLYLVLSDGSEIKVEGLAGITGEVGDADGVTLGTGYPIFKEISDGITFWFKGITAEGSMFLYATDNVIGISGDKQYQEGATAENLAKNRFLYLGPTAGDTADSSGLSYVTGDNSMAFGHGVTGNRWTYDPEENIVVVPEIEKDEIVDIYGNPCIGCGITAGDGVGIQLAVTAGSVFDVSTPIGIAGFTGNFRSEEIFNFTMLLKGNDIWDWPDNVYINDKDRFFSCGTDIINFFTDTAGESWYANVAVRG